MNKPSVHLGYEVFAQFLSRLHKNQTPQEVFELLCKRLKYIVEVRAFRVCFYFQGKWNILNISGSTSYIKETELPDLLPFERELWKEKRPVMQKGEAKNLTADALGVCNKSVKEIWGWNFVSQPNKLLLICAAVGEEDQIGPKEIEMVRLLAESLDSKLTEIVLRDDLSRVHHELQESAKNIREKNQEIQAIVENQEKTIESQTRELRRQNDELFEISMFNAHSVREPLSRILGLTQLLEHEDPESQKEMIPMLATAAQEMDAALQKVIQRAARNVA